MKRPKVRGQGIKCANLKYTYTYKYIVNIYLIKITINAAIVYYLCRSAKIILVRRILLSLSRITDIQ
jgi:hypothetical protein